MSWHIYLLVGFACKKKGFSLCLKDIISLFALKINKKLTNIWISFYNFATDFINTI